MKVSGILDIHHIHIWAISTTENVLTAHLVLQKDTNYEQEQNIKKLLRHELAHNNIYHINLETERDGMDCEEKDC